MRGVIVALAVLMTFSSCTAMKIWLGIGYEKPIVKLNGIDVVHAELSKVELSLDVSVENPNDFDLQLMNLRYSLANASKAKVAAGAYQDRLIIRAMETTTIKVPVSLKPESLGSSLARFLLAPNQAQKFQIDTTADFITELGPIEVSATQIKDLCIGKCG